MRVAILLVALLLGLAAPAFADDTVAAQKVIRAQEQALARDDAAAAYSHAAPPLQRMFGDPDTFMAMVRSGYAPVYRHKSFEFGESRTTDGRIEQDVRIVDANGVPWDALYFLEAQPDGSLKIIGCTLKAVGTSA
jgi:type II secretory pathway pseudopilin PulG